MLDGRRLSVPDLLEAIDDARSRTLRAIADLPDDALAAPRGPLLNPLAWEVGHVAWFQERHAVRRAGGPSVLDRADGLYDSIAVPHEVRFDLELPDRGRTLWYLESIRDAARADLERAGGDWDALHRHAFAVFHEDMHGEAFLMARQLLGWPRPSLGQELARTPSGSGPGGGDRDDGPGGPLEGDVDVPGGPFEVGARREAGFAFDNEKWATRVELLPFSIARAPVTEARYAEFVEDGGYRTRALWSDAGWAWRKVRDADHPVSWRRDADGAWERRRFDTWSPLSPHHPVVHVSWYEAEAYCRWAGRRLPSEAEWEAAALLDPATGQKRAFPWGDDLPTERHANLDASVGGPVDVSSRGDGDSPVGCRQMIGNVWEWTADAFTPLPGFEFDFYAEYSAPMFGFARVLKGGAWTTRARLLRGTLRNFYEPRRNDPFVGFRTCAVR